MADTLLELRHLVQEWMLHTRLEQSGEESKDTCQRHAVGTLLGGCKAYRGKLGEAEHDGLGKRNVLCVHFQVLLGMSCLGRERTFSIEHTPKCSELTEE